MEFEKLFYLVHSLSKGERSRFTKYNNRRKGKLSKALYDRILKYDTPTDKIEKLIRGQMFKPSQRFCDTRTILAKMLIESMVQVGTGPISFIKFAKTAAQHGAITIVESSAAAELRSLQHEEEFGAMLMTYDALSEIEAQYGLNLSLPDDVMPYEHIVGTLRVKKQLLEFLKLTKESMRKPQSQRLILAHYVEAFQIFSGKSTYNQILAEKLKMRLALLRMDLPQAFKHSFRFLDMQTKYNKKFPSVELAREIRSIAVIAVYFNARDQAMNYLLKLDLLTPKSLHERREILRSKLSIQTTIAVKYANDQIALKCCEILDKKTSMYTLIELSGIYHSLALTFFFNEKWKMAIKWFEKTNDLENSLPPEKRSVTITSIRRLQIALCYFMLGNITISDSLIRSLKTAAKDLPLKFPGYATSLVWRYTSDRAINSVRELELYDQIVLNDEERRASFYFPINIWIEAIARQVSQRVILLEKLNRRTKEDALKDFVKDRLQG